MRKLSFIFTLMFVFTSIFGQGDTDGDNVHTTVRSYYEDGTIASEINYINNKPIGVYRFYYPDGSLMEEGVWNEKHLTGNFKRYYANGQVAQEFYYDDDGRRKGKQKYFYQSGDIQAEKQMGPPQHIVVRYTSDGKEKVYISF